MANPEHLAILKQGVEVWNKWRQDHPEIMPDLRSCDLQCKNSQGADFSHTDFTEADISNSLRMFSDFRQANCTYTVLSRTEFHEANLRQADLSSASASGTKFARAVFSGTRFIWTALDNADFSHAEVGWCVFADVDLTSVKGLLTVQHTGPSTIGTDTLRRCRGRVPREFLVGAGIPDPLIEDASLSDGGTSQFHSCFISYSTKDQEFADLLHADMRNNGVRCWFAPHNIQGGKKIHDQIDEAIRVYDRLLLVLSEHSMNSEWVKTGIANARQREIREERQMLFPISLVRYDRIKEWRAFDADTGKDSAREIREYFIPDFSNWKDHDSYQQAFQKLLRDLRAEERESV
jgi:hypothetical protein